MAVAFTAADSMAVGVAEAIDSALPLLFASPLI
jgi:hypothetical protein